MVARAKAFVVMPFAREFDDVWTELIKPALEQAGFVATRADSVLNQRNILQDVVLGIGEATLVVADLTGLNGNVMYELGLAHGLRRRVILITQNLQEVPFDLRAYRVIEYSTRFGRSSELVSTITEIAANLPNSNFGSPVTDFWHPDGAADAYSEVEISSAAREVGPAEVEAAIALIEDSVRALISHARTAGAPIGNDTDTLVNLANILQPDESLSAKPGLFRRRGREQVDLVAAEEELTSWINALGVRLNEHVDDVTRELEKIQQGVSTIASADQINFPAAVVKLNRWRSAIPDQVGRIGNSEISLREFAKGCEVLSALYPSIRRASDRTGAPLWTLVDRYVSAQAQLSRLENLLETKPAPADNQ